MPILPDKTDTTWQVRAACRDEPNFQFWDDHEQVRMCVACPVMDACRAFAIALEPAIYSDDIVEWPVYGGLTSKERQKIIRRLKSRSTAAA